jgi:diacylglycerol kinase family enzyme
MFDGDILGVSPVEASVVPGALNVVVPADGG